MCGIKFFFQHTLGREWKTFEFLRPPKEKKLPVVQRAVMAYEEALRFRTPERAPLNYAATQNNLGLALISLSKYGEGQERDNPLRTAKKGFLTIEGLQPGRSSYNLACVTALLGEEKECKGWLEKCLEQDRLPLREHVDQDPDLDPVRKKSWFKKFLEDAYGEE